MKRFVNLPAARIAVTLPAKSGDMCALTTSHNREIGEYRRLPVIAAIAAHSNERRRAPALTRRPSDIDGARAWRAASLVFAPADGPHFSRLV